MITPGFAGNEADTTCIPAQQDFLKCLIQTFPEIKPVILALDYPHSNEFYEWNSIPVYPMNRGKRKIRFLTSDIQKQAEQIKKLHPNISAIHSFWWGPAAIAGNKLSAKWNVPHVCTLMGQDANVSNKYLNRIDQSIPKIVAISNRQAKIFETNTGRKPDLVNSWGINPEDFPTENNIHKRSIDLVFAGSLIPLKQPDIFVQLVKKLTLDFPQLSVAIAGGGILQKQIRELIDSLDLSKHVKLYGELSRPEVLKLMRQSKILVHTSEYEGQGFVFNEALASGMNIVSFSVGIAEASPQWKVCDTANEMEDVICEMLINHKSPKPDFPFLMTDTVNGYKKLYMSNESNK